MPQALTKAGIANLALTLIGQKPIPAADTAWTTTTEAIKVKAVWENARLIALRDHNWKFAKRRIELTAVTNDTYSGWDYIWAYPSTTHHIRKVYVDTDSANPDPVQYAQFNGAVSGLDRIATNDVDDDDKAYAECTYTGEGTSDAQYLTYDPMFVTAFALQVAFMLALPLTGDKGLADRMAAQYQAVLRRAKLLDSNEDRVLSPRKNESTFLTARG